MLQKVDADSGHYQDRAPLAQLDVLQEVCVQLLEVAHQEDIDKRVAHEVVSAVAEGAWAVEAEREPKALVDYIGPQKIFASSPS